MQSSPWAVYPRRHLFPNYEEKTQFVWKSIWLNLQEVATCSSVSLQPPNNCVSLQQIKTQINWSGLSESNWFEHIGSLGFPLLSPPPYLPLHLAKYFTWIWPREWQQYLNYLKKTFQSMNCLSVEERIKLYIRRALQGILIWGDFGGTSGQWSFQILIETSFLLSATSQQQFGSPCSSSTSTNSIAERWTNCFLFILCWTSVFCLGWLDLIFTLCCQPIHD